MQHVCFWNSEVGKLCRRRADADEKILNPIARYGIEAGNPGHTSFRKLKILLDRMMLR
jgi:DNA repair protein RAD16